MKTLLLRASLAALLGAAQLFITPQLQAAGPARAVAFDGVNDFVSASIPETLESSYTFGAWVFLCAGGSHSVGRVAVLTGAGADDCGSTVEVLIHSATGSATDPQFIELGRCSGFSGELSTTPVPIKQWVHIAVTVDAGRQVSYFVNGAPAGAWDGSPRDLSLNTRFTLGFNRHESLQFDGMLGEVQIWKTNLTQAQIQASMNRNFSGTRSNLVLSYLLAETGGVTLSNSAPTGSAHNGALRNGALRFKPATVIRAPGVSTVPAAISASSVVTLMGTITPKGLPARGWFEWGTSTSYGDVTEPGSPVGSPQAFSFPLARLTPGVTYHYRAVAGHCLGTNFGANRTFVAPAPRWGQALFLDGDQQYVSITNFGSIAPTNEVTVEFWAYTTAIADNSVFALSPDVPENRFQSHLTWNNGRMFWDFGNISGAGRISPAYPANSLGNWIHYAMVASESGDSMTIYTNGVLCATQPGMDPFERYPAELRIGAGNYQGQLDEFRIWNTARSQAQIQAGLAGPLAGNEAGLLLYYRFDEPGGAVASNRATATGPAFHGTLVNGPHRFRSDIPVRTDFTVTTLADSGPGSLRESVLQAGALSDALDGTQVIRFAAKLAGKTIRLTSGQVPLEGTLTLDASALPGGIRIDGGRAGRIFFVNEDSTVVLDSLTITNGYISESDNGDDDDGQGGGIYNDGTLTLNRCTVAGNTAEDRGGGIYNSNDSNDNNDNNDNMLTVNHSTFAGNTGDGAGGLQNSGTAIINHSTFAGNAGGEGSGGAIHNDGALTINQSTLTGNSADEGGALFDHDTMTVNQCTITGNSAREGDGIYLAGEQEATIFNSIIAGNSAVNSGPNIFGSFNSAGVNLTSGNPKLAPLGNYGGPTQTMPPLIGSPAIDGGFIDTEFTTDQRGFPRFIGGAPDIGAVESTLPCLRAYYSFDNRTAVDETGNSTATYAGECDQGWDADHLGRPDSAAAFSYYVGCSNRYLLQTAAHPGNANLDLGLKGSFTVAVWIYPLNTGGDHWVLGNTGGGGGGTLHLGLRDNRANLGFFFNVLRGAQTIPTNRWTHLAFTYNLQGGIMAIYVNGQLDASESGHPNSLGDHDLLIGWLEAAGNASYFDGRIDDLAIYCQALAPNQIAALASDSVKPNELLPSPDLPLPAPNGCVWSVREIYAHPHYPTNITSAEYIAHTAGLGTFIDYQSDVINFNDPQTSPGNNGFMGGDRPYRSNNLTPTGAAGGDDNDFVLAARTTLVITEEDDYTFGFSSDDGARLRIKGAVFQSSTRLNGGNPANPAHHGDTLVFPDPTANSATLGVAHLTPGAYEIEFLTYEALHGAYCEVFYARGAKTAFDSSFRLLGYNGPSALTATVTPFVQVITNGAAPRTVRFTVQAGVVGENHYQWLFNGSASLPGNVSGATTATLTITNATEANAGDYSVYVVNAFGSTVSSPALLIFKSNVAPDNQKPSLTLTSPAPASLRVLSDSIRLAGIASDNGTLKGVYVATGSGPYQQIMDDQGKWSLTLPLTPGTNVFRVVAVDAAGNVSKPQTRTVYYAVPDVLTVTVSPGGSVAPNLDGKVLEVGRNYSMRATAAKGYIFSNWTGGVLCSGPLIKFPMSPGLMLQANFVRNPFAKRAGDYNGLLHETAAIRHDRSGFFTGKVTSSGGFSGYVKIDGKKLPLSGKFDLGGNATNLLKRTGTNALRLELQFDPNGPPQLLGRLTDGEWIANLIADLAPVVPKRTSVPLAGKYTFVWYFNRDDAGAGSVGAISVSSKSRATILTTFADGSTTTQSVPMPTNGPIPFYVDLYKGQGSALGWLNLNRSAPNGGAVFGLLNWYRPASPGPGLFASGFEFARRTYGSTYVSPTNNRVLNFTNAALRFGLFDEGVVFSNPLRLGSGGKVVNLATNAMKMSVNLANGLYSGTTVEPGTGRAVTFKGAVLQDYDYGDGWWLTTNSSGWLGLFGD